MRYLLMIHANEGAWEALSEAEREEVRGRYGAAAREARDRGWLVHAAELRPTSAATTVRVADGEAVVTDGPYAETKEALGGYFLVDCNSMQDALELAQRLPAPRGAGGIEIRPAYVEEGAAAA